MPVIAKPGPAAAPAHDAVTVGFERVALLDSDHVAAGLLVELDGAGEAAPFAEGNHVGQEQRERLVADDVAGAPDRVAEPERRLLTREAHHAGRRLQSVQRRELCFPAWASVSSSSGCTSK